MNKPLPRPRLPLACALALCVGSASATEITGDAYAVFAEDAPDGAISLSITGPQETRYESDSLTLYGESPLDDGHYSYAIVGTLSGDQVSYSAVKRSMNSGRGDAAEPPNKPVGVIDSGRFQILDGVVAEAEQASTTAAEGGRNDSLDSEQPAQGRTEQ